MNVYMHKCKSKIRKIQKNKCTNKQFDILKLGASRVMVAITLEVDFFEVDTITHYRGVSE